MKHREKDLFGHPIKSHAPARASRGVRKIGYAARLATGPKNQRCGTCKHAMKVEIENRSSHKCELMAVVWGRKPGEETDISLRAPACAKWERKPFDKEQAA